jgi:ferric-dicitrate binding protein FerR (iron transport regulator)
MIAGLLALLGLQSPTTVSADIADPGHLTSRPRPPASTVETLKVGTEIQTEAGQRRRINLPGGSVLYINENTTAKLEAPDRLAVTAGEVYLDTVSADKNPPFLVQTPKREIRGSRSSFGVRALDTGTDVVVTRGKVKVSGLTDSLVSGQRLAPESSKPVAAPRASHVLAWTRDLAAAAETPLVPSSQFAGGALLAIDPNGQEAKLSLRKFHIDVHIEDGFARTTIDQTYFNHESSRLEGTFYFPLPPDASLSRLAMYVDGNLMEGGMAERDYARAVYETIRYAQRDPALLEWVDGSTFKMRVFPLEPRQEKRIILSYSQRLPTLYGQMQYRFPAGHSLQQVKDWSFHALLKNGADFQVHSVSHPKLAIEKKDSDLVLNLSAKQAKTDRDVLLTITDKKTLSSPSAVRFATTTQDGFKYLMLRYRPQLSGAAQGQRRDWVFLVETSGDRDPLLARVQIDILRALLHHAESEDTFSVLTAGTRVKAFAAKPQPVTEANVEEAVKFLEGAHLIGALDLGKALSEVEPLLKNVTNPHLVHLGSGIAAMGERREDVLAKRLPEGTRYVGVGVGKRWARSFMKMAAERTGGYFTQINPDEPIGWRSFELFATLNTPRLLDLKVTDNEEQASFLNYDNTLAQGEELCAIARIKGSLPESVTVTGTLEGKQFVQKFEVKDVAAKADYLPRTWAKLEIDRLLAEDAVKHKDKVIALSKAMYVMTPFTSLLVLENEEMYQQYKVDRGRQDHWAMYPCPKKIPIVHEPDPEQVANAAKGLKPARQVLATLAGGNLVQSLSQSLEREGIGEAKKIEKAITKLDVAKKPSRTVARSPGVDFLAKVHLQTAGSALHGGGIERGFGTTPAVYYAFPAAKFSPDGRQLLQGAGAGIPAVAGPSLERGWGWDGHPPSQGQPYRVGHITIHGNTVDKLMLARKMAQVGSPNGALPLGGKPELAFLAEPSPEISWKLSKQVVDMFVDRELGGQKSLPSLLYQRPTFSGEDRLFFDLVSYAPGLSTSWSDIEAVLETEAFPNPYAKAGKIDADARKLLEKARFPGWQALTFAEEDGMPGYTLFFDSSGRFMVERTLPPGLKERVVCDGKTLLHLYPELGLAARRNVSRFHRADLSTVVPWVVPPAEDLARGADLKRIGERTVAIIPHGAATEKDKDGILLPYYAIHLLFAGDGELVEKRLIRMTHDKKGWSSETRYRLTLSPDGVVKLLDAGSKELSVRKGKLSPAKAPDLKADIKKLVVLSLPYRTSDHIRQSRKIEKKGLEELTFEDARALLAAAVAAGNASEALNVFRQSLFNRNQRDLGYYVLLASCGVNLDAQNADVLAEHLDEPLAQYLALHSSPVLRKHASQWAVGSKQWGEGFLGHLALTHALYQRWQNPKINDTPPAKRKAERDRALDYVRRNKGTLFGWGLLCLMQDRAEKDKPFHLALAEACTLFEEIPGLEYVARYERARSLLRGGQSATARKQLRALYEKTFKDDLLPAIDTDFRLALLGDGKGKDEWGPLLRQTAAQLIEQKRRLGVLALTWQCWQLDDQPLAEHLFTTALHKLPEKEHLGMTLAGIAFLSETGQLPQADKLLQTLLDDPKLAKRPSLWRLAAKLAERRDLPSRELECLERALEMEYQQLPEIVDLERVRREYGRLLDHYQNLATAAKTLKVQPPQDFLAKVVRAADRWRALDRDATRAAEAAARILQALEDRELAWDYLTTPIALRPGEAEPWVNLAWTLSRKGELRLADRAYRAAFESEPTNAQILWDRAQNLKQAGKLVEAQKLFRQLAEGQWQPRFNWLQTQAQWQIKGP